MGKRPGSDSARRACAALLWAVLAASPGLAAPPLVVSGRLLLPDGQAAAGATVELVPLVVARGDAAVVGGRSAALGHFELAVPQPGMWRLVALAPGGLVGERPLALAESVQLPVLTLLPASDVAAAPREDEAMPRSAQAVRGRVLDAVSRQPLARALVWPLADPAAAVWSNAEGVFVFPAGALPARGWQLGAVAAGHLPRMGPGIGVMAEDATVPELLLTPASTVAGVVVDAQGRPLPAAELRALRDLRSGYLPGQPLFSAHFAPDAEGGFRLALVPGGAYQLQARAPGLAAASLDLVAPVAGQVRAGLRLELGPGLLAAGRVVDAAGAPVAGAWVALVPADERLSGERRADHLARAASAPDGRFEFSHLVAGRYHLAAGAEGFASTHVPGLRLAGPAAGTVDLGTVVLVAGWSVSGRVTDRRGEPLAGVQVMVEGQRAEGLLGQLDAEARPDPLTDAEGRFAVAALQPQRPVNLRFHAAGYLPRVLERLQPPQEEPLEVVLDDALELAGRVVDARGEGVAEAELQLQPHRVGGPCFGCSGRAADDGTFRLTGLAPGSYLLQVSAEGLRPTRLDDVELSAEREPAELTVRLERGAVLEGRVLTPEGEPAAGAYVTPVVERSLGIFGAAAMVLSAEADHDGGYRLAGLEVGPMSVEAYLEGYPRLVRDVEIAAGSNRLDLVFSTRGVTVSGRVVDGAGAPLAGVQVSLVGGSSGQGAASSGAGGSFTVAGMLPGSYTVYAQKTGHADFVSELPLAVAAEPIRDLELRLAPGGRIDGRVVGPDYEQMLQVALRAHHLSQPLATQARVDFEGRFELTDLAAGEWQVTARVGSGGRPVSERVTLAAGGRAEVELVFEPPGDLTLSGLLLSGGEPLAGVRLDLLDAAGYRTRGQTDARGRFVVRELAAGAYELSAELPQSGLFHRQTLELDADLEVVIEVATASLAGTVVDAGDGSPLAGALVSLKPLAAGPSAPVQVRTGGRGGFLLSGVPAGRWRLLAQLPGYGGAVRELDLGAGDEAELELRLAPTAGLELIVTLPSGLPAAYAVAVLLDAAGEPVASASLGTREGGRLELASAPPGRWQLLVSAASQATASLQVEVPGRVEVQLPPAGALYAVVPALLADAAAMAQAQLLDAAGQPYRLAGWGGSVLSGWPVFDGRLRLPAVPAGRWQLVVTAADGRTWTRDVEVVGGSSTADLVIQ